MQQALPPPLDDALRRELGADERLLWCAQPLVGGLMMASLPVTLFGIPFLGFAIFWVTTAATATRGPNTLPTGVGLMPLFGLPFIVVGLVMVLSPLWAALKAGRTVYAVTSRGALLIEGAWGRGREVSRFGPDQLKSITRRERFNGGGDLIFAYDFYERPRGRGYGMRPRGFLSVPDVHGAEEALRAVAASPLP